MPALFGYRLERDFDLTKEQRDAGLTRALLMGLILLCVYGLFRTFTAVMFQAYVTTVVSYGMVFYVKRGKDLRKPWLWKAIIASVPVHALYLGGLFWLDKALPEVMTKVLGFMPVLILGCAIECALFDSIADRLKPPIAPPASGQTALS